MKRWVHVYYNIPKDTLSLRGTDGIVFDHRDRVVLKDAEFRVQPAGRKRCLEEGQRNIHAKVHGWLCSQDPPVDCPVAVKYDPFDAGVFQTVSGGEAVEQSPWVIIDKTRCYIPEEA